MTNQLKRFTNKAGRLTWAINLNSDGTFSFMNYNKTCYRISKEQLIAGWWEGSVPKEVRNFAIQYK
tara:strand:+ start:64 stop:261 length:198 start_codon:yes stop_codon:yes gene_type:complete